MRLGVIVPTRGLVFTETVIGLLEATEGITAKFYLSHNLPTPDSFNELTNRAMDEGMTHLLITNDDVVITPEILEAMIALDEDVVTCPTPLTDTFSGYYEKNGEITLTGTSCVLVRREVLEKIGRPYFRTDVRYIMLDDKEYEKNVDPQSGFGGEEAYFSRQVRKAGYKIRKVDMLTRHLRLVNLGEHHSNNGCHTIVDL